MEKRSAVEEFLGELSGNKETNPFEENAENPFEQPQGVETNEIVEEVKEEKPLPFNKDPKVLKFIDKEIEKRMKDRVVEEKPAQQVTQEDDYYVRLIGNDTPEKVAMIREAMARDERLLQQAEERAFNRLSQKEQEALLADKQAEEELENAFENIEENYGVDISSNSTIARKTRQEFVTFIEKIAPKDRNGDIVDYPDMTSAWETFQEIKKSTATPSRAKELASRGMSRSAEATSTPATRPTWDAADEFISSLGK